MNRRYCLVFGVVVLASCSSTDAPAPAGGGASATAGANAAGSPAGGSSGASSAGAAGLATSAGAGNVSGAAPGAGAGGTSGGASGAAGANSAGAPAGSGGASGASGASGAGGSAGKGGSGGNAGGAGAPAKYCDGKTLTPAPVIVTDRFNDNDDNSVTGKDLSDQLAEWVLPDNCDDSAEDNAVGSCHEYEYTPEPDGGVVKWAWLSDPAGIKYAPVCMAAGMTKVAFRARGYLGGEKVTFGASQATPVDITLTTTWTQYSISLANVKYNSDSQGVQPGFYWTLVETLNPGKASVRFDIDDIKYVND